jgi:hypothetical protein
MATAHSILTNTANISARSSKSFFFRVDLALVDAKAPLRALADVVLQLADGELIIRRCPVFEKVGEPAWATLPRLPLDKNSKRTYWPLIDMQRDLKKRVLDAVLSEYGRKVSAR